MLRAPHLIRNRAASVFLHIQSAAAPQAHRHPPAEASRSHIRRTAQQSASPAAVPPPDLRCTARSPPMYRFLYHIRLPGFLTFPVPAPLHLMRGSGDFLFSDLTMRLSLLLYLADTNLTKSFYIYNIRHYHKRNLILRQLRTQTPKSKDCCLTDAAF